MDSNTSSIPQLAPDVQPPVDLAGGVKGMYRILDLISESGGNGNVDKVIVAQHSLRRFTDAILVAGGAYAPSTKIDFKILDQFSIRPLGIYGSKEEIVRLLQSIGAVDEKLARLLLAPIEVNGPQLSSGLYIVKASTEASSIGELERHYVIYWPEDSTWDDSAVPSVRHNRVAFMRYLTKICDQVVALLSTDHCASLVLYDENDDSDIGNSGDPERLFTFEVAETIEQEDSVVSRPGFQMNSSIIAPFEVSRYCSIDASLLGPRLLPGETVQGLLTVVHIPPQVRTETLDERSYSKEALSQLLKSNALVLSEELDEDAVETLVREALEGLFPKQCKEWHVRKQHVHKIFMQERLEKSRAVARDLADTEGSLHRVLREEVVDHVISIFPSLDRGGLSSSVGGTEIMDPRSSMRLSDIRTRYPTTESIIAKYIEEEIFDYIPTRCWDFKVLKFGVIALSQLLSENKHLRREARSALFQAFVVEHNFQKALQILPDGSNFPTHWTSSFWSDLRAGEFNDESFKKEMRKTVALVSDSQFLQQLESTDDDDLRSVVHIAKALAQTELSSSIDSVVQKMTVAAMSTQKDEYGREMQLQVDNEEREVLNIALVDFIREINKASAVRQNSTVYIDRVEVVKESNHPTDLKLKITGRLEVVEMNHESQLELRIHPMDLTSDDKHIMRLDPKHIPTPSIDHRLSSSFRLSTSVEAAFYQLLENEMLLLILADQDKFLVYLERLPVMDMAIQQGRPIKRLNRDKLGRGVLFAFDETKRTLAVCASTKMQLYAFIFDETFRTLQGQEIAVDLAPWYREGTISILLMASVCGREEIVLVDSSARVRMFSFVKLQFRPESLQLQTRPNAIYSSPDGSCLLVLHTRDSGSSLTAYHLETFGSTEGITLDVHEYPIEGAVLTSMVRRGRVFFLVLDIHARVVKSVAIDITTKVIQFMFKEKGKKLCRNMRHTQHNSLLDCHAEVWTRFPVLPAMKRHAITSLSERRQKTLTFVADDHTRSSASYFSKLVQTFGKTTRKPTGDVLHGIGVSAAQFQPFWATMLSSWDWNVSRYPLGDWLVDLLCLVPIHIAVCCANRFIPLADGVFSAELGKSLLGAEVSEIVDRLSFGWYEPIFQYYSDLKPVKVVSSIGQQSGESYLMNHLVDTSFSGSAMRTTGVWMSVMPTDEALIVALYFEGVGSIERSQEDTLLILFNTAISNLVLFHNNFASSRDISGVFGSFQSSASVLDPAANPMLFQSTLVMIIEDVLEHDAIEITRELSLKFQHIAQQERGANFVSRLHRGKLDIIPFPEIKSREFYTLLSTLKKRLDLQNVSHPAAGEFYYAMKILMAKLNANDWRTLSYTMAEHRAKSLSSLLPIVLATGYSQIEPDLKRMKNLDSELTVQCEDTAAYFSISEHGPHRSEDVEICLTALREFTINQRQSPQLRKKMKKGRPAVRQEIGSRSKGLEELTSHLNKLIELRVNHVRLWLDSNLQRFQGGHAAIEDLHRRFDSLVVEMKANVQLCGARCASKSCDFLCIRSRFHDDDHICQTSHKCVHSCVFCGTPCGIAAGHPGNHVCVVSAHLCGNPCKLSERRGCLGDCTKATGHAEDEHMCSSLAHMCGEPCALRNIQLLGGKTFSCQQTCSIHSELHHTSHSCDTMLCPVTCELCKRRCVQSHLHGLTPGAHHLCGETHLCPERCAALGICQIDTSLQSIEATSTNLQYTKYTQVAKRKLCIRTIPPGLLMHQGEHIHSNEEEPFHSCEARCKDCGYFCTLSLGHAQSEHETSHGYMTGTRWDLDGPDDATSLELGGYNISSNGKETPVMCNFVCSSMGRHVHIDYCCTDGNGPCDTAEARHISHKIGPEPDEPKDAVTHSLYWRRMGFKDPYTRDEQAIFGKCDAICSGPEHAATETASGQPSYCTLPMFHSPHNITEPADGDGYVSNDGHKFSCRNPALSS